MAALLNIPFGTWREHTKKFSPEWFLAVHATIPLIAPLRKAVLMPRWAIALTIASAIAGQYTGARLERMRLAAKSRCGSIDHAQQPQQQHTPWAGAACLQPQVDAVSGAVSISHPGSASAQLGAHFGNQHCREVLRHGVGIMSGLAGGMHTPLACGYGTF